MAEAATVIKLQAKSTKIVTITPEKATALLERNTCNRPLSEMHVKRIARLIEDGNWMHTGDTIKVSETGDLLDGQHRLWAIIQTNTPCVSTIAYGIDPAAFAYIDTVQKGRSGADVIALMGTPRYRNVIASALTWLIRYERGVIVEYKAPEHRVENHHIEAAFEAHPEIVRAVEKAMRVRRLCNVSIMAFFYYVLANRDQALAERMMETLENPAKVPLSDPFFRLRNYFTADHHRQKNPVVTVALAIKAANAAREDKKLQALMWRCHGRTPEEFPTLEV